MYPVLAAPFGFPIFSYSVILVLSFLMATRLAVHIAQKRGPTDTQYLQGIAFAGILWGLVGSRLGWVLQHPEVYLQSPWQIFHLREGGMTILGGIIVPPLALLAMARRKGFDGRNVLDTFAAPLLLGMAIGRIGCILNGCCYGDVCDPSFPFALTYPVRPGMPMGPRYATQLFEAVADLALMGILIWLTPRIKFAGQAAGVAIGGYGMIRFLNEFVRADGRELVAGGFTVAHLLALALVFLGAFAACGGLGKPPIDVKWQAGQQPQATTDP